MGFDERENKRKGVVSAIIGGNALNHIDTNINNVNLKENKIRVSLTISPKLYKDIKKIAFVERTSVSEIVTTCLEEYANSKSKELKDYEIIKNNT